MSNKKYLKKLLIQTTFTRKKHSFLLLFFVLLSVFSSPTPVQARSAQETRSTCLSTEQRRPTEQLQACTQALKAFPKEYRLWQRRAQLYFQQRNYTQASQDLSEAIKLQPQNFDLLMARAMSHQLAGKTREAQADARAAKKVREQSDSLAALLLKGLEYTQQGKWNEAIDAYTNALKKAPKDPELYLARGTVYAAKEDILHFESDFHKAIALAPRVASTYARFGKLYNHLQEPSKALPYLDKAIAMDPQPFEPWSDRGYARFLLQEDPLKFENTDTYLKYAKQAFPPLIEDFSEALKRNSKHELSRLSRAFAYGLVGQFAEQALDYTLLLKENPKHLDYLMGRANAYTELRKFPEALKDISQVLTIDPEYENAVTYKLMLLLILDQKDTAQKTVQAELDKDPNQISALNVRGYLSLRKGAFESAAQDFKHSKELDSSQGANLYAWILGILKQFSEAHQEINLLLKANPHDWDTLHTQAWIYTLEGKADQAIPVFQQFIEQVQKQAPYHLDNMLDSDLKNIQQFYPQLTADPRFEKLVQTLSKAEGISDPLYFKELYNTFEEILSSLRDSKTIP